MKWWADMSETQTGESTSGKPLRLWPGVALAVLLVLLRFAVPLVVIEMMPIGSWHHLELKASDSIVAHICKAEGPLGPATVTESIGVIGMRRRSAASASPARV